MDDLRFLVIDEADRMISQGNFPQLKQILAFIQEKSPHPDAPDENDDSDSESDSDSDDDSRLKSLHGVRGEAKVKMLDMNILKQIELQKMGKAPSSALMDEEDIEEIADEENFLDEDAESNSILSNKKYEPRQTFVYSATLTLPSSDLSFATEKKKRKSRNKKKTVEGAIADILEKAGAFGQTKVVDLTSDSTIIQDQSGNKNSMVELSLPRPSNTNKRLPPGLSLYQILCTQKHKDSHCYAYLATTQQGSSGPSLIFCNSISGVKRVGVTLQTLGLPVRMLHAQMAQVS